ncbi:hypothetical protein C1H76_8318 [Elsinoe australis]|uniref:Uncharacterized protein n=1 Tax=Elsinoe australis TaxID=40998 RepID=A0A4U7ANM0_9PEZI|nr:hypothetical protein C1H76_8318 [Elsinoe australis]
MFFLTHLWREARTWADRNISPETFKIILIINTVFSVAAFFVLLFAYFAYADCVEKERAAASNHTSHSPSSFEPKDSTSSPLAPETPTPALHMRPARIEATGDSGMLIPTGYSEIPSKISNVSLSHHTCQALQDAKIMADIMQICRLQPGSKGEAHAYETRAFDIDGCKYMMRMFDKKQKLRKIWSDDA